MELIGSDITLCDNFILLCPNNKGSAQYAAIKILNSNNIEY